MRIAICIAAATAAILAGGCDDSEPTQPNRPIVVRSPAQDQLHQLSDVNREIALRRAIYDSGSACRRVDESGYVQEYKNLSMWMARCSDRRSWALFVGPDGNVQVRRCQEMEQLGLPACVIRSDRTAVSER